MKTKSKYVLAFLLILGVLFMAAYILLGLNRNHSKPLNIVYIPKIIDETNDFWTTLISGANMAANEYEANLTITAPLNETDYQRQNELLKQALATKPDVIIFSPISYTESIEAVKHIRNNQIPVLLIDSQLEENLAHSIVATDNYLAGFSMGEYMKTLITPKSVIAIVSHVKDTSTAIEREQGFRDALGTDIDRIVETVFCDSNFDKAYTLTKELLDTYPEIDLIAGLNEYSAVGAGKAIRDLELKDQVHIVGFDNSIAAIQLLEEGIFEGIVIQKAFNMGYLGIESAVKLGYGEYVPPIIDSGSELITRENMYTDQGQKLLFSFLETKDSK